MFVTNLIKDKIYRQFLLDRFPKPIGKKTPTLGISVRSNPSKLGNTIELFFKLLLSRKIKTLDLAAEIESFNSNIDWFLNENVLFFDTKETRVILAPKVKFNLAKREIKNNYPKKLFKTSTKNGIKSIKVDRYTFLHAGIIKNLTDLPVLNPIDSKGYVIMMKEDLNEYLTNLKNEIPNDIANYIKSGKITENLINGISQLTSISSQFFKFKPNIIETVPKEILSEIQNRLELLAKITSKKKWKVAIYKPDLSWQNIRARPDFLIDNEIFEIKITNKFLSTHDYLQVLTCLLFTIHKKKQNSGLTIKKAILFYPLTNMSFEFNEERFQLDKKDEKTFTKMLIKFNTKGCC